MTAREDVAAWRRAATCECPSDIRTMAGSIAQARIDGYASERFLRLCQYEAAWAARWEIRRRELELEEAQARRERFRMVVGENLR